MKVQPTEFETRLAQLALRAPSTLLERRIAASLVLSCRRSDRRLWSAIGAGLAAVCVIVGIMVSEPSPSSQNRHDVAQQGKVARGVLDSPDLARADLRWGGQIEVLARGSLP